MAAPQLKMNKADIEIAISREFRRTFSTLKFSKGQSFGKIDTTSNSSFFLQRNYDGVGEYNFRGQVGLYNSANNYATTYNLSGRVLVVEENGSPIINFIDVISCTKF